MYRTVSVLAAGKGDYEIEPEPEPGPFLLRFIEYLSHFAVVIVVDRGVVWNWRARNSEFHHAGCYKLQLKAVGGKEQDPIVRATLAVFR